MTNTDIQNERKWAKRIALTALVGATIMGTYTGSNGIIPLLNSKYKDSYGINLSFGNLQESNTTIYGVNIGIVNLAEGGSKLNGLEIGLANMPDSNSPKKLNGLQIGLGNSAYSGNLIQIGLFNKIILKDGKERNSVIFNCAFEGDSK